MGLEKMHTSEELMAVAEAAAEKAAMSTAETLLVWLELNQRQTVANNPDFSALSRSLLRNYRHLKLLQKKRTELAEQSNFGEPWMGFVRFMGGTGIELQLIEAALELYRQECENSGSEEAMRRYRVVDMMFLMEKESSALQIADSEHVSKQTVYADISKAYESISYYLEHG